MTVKRSDAPTVKVWDPLVRIIHWSLVAGVAAAWFVHGKWHEWIGYAVLGAVTLRILWGFAGSRYARFAQFVHAPAHTRQYAKSVANGVEPRHLGHNPLGAWMIVTLLATLVAICATGWLYTTDRFWGETWVENVHIAASYFVLALVALHVAGVIFSSLRHGENLVAAMLHGRKRAPGPGDVP